VVDDDAGFRGAARRLVETVLEATVVGEATNGEEASQLARELQPDVILMDLIMPGFDGLEATRLIKAERPETKVIILTVHDEVAYRKAAGESRADSFIVKKTLTDELLPTMRRIIGRPCPCPVADSQP